MKVSKVEDWEEESNLDISRAIRDSKVWKDDLKKIVEIQRSLEDIVATHELTEDDDFQFSEANALVNRVASEVREAINAIQGQDDARELYSLNTVKIPESPITDIDDAWAALELAFGDSSRLMKSRKEKLAKLGILPKENCRGGLKAQVEWYLEVEALVKSIIDLGKEDEDLGMLAFNPDAINKIILMFPSNIMNKFIKCPGKGRSKLEAVLKKLRIDTQKKVLVVESTAPATGGGASGGGGGQVGVGHGSGSQNGRNPGKANFAKQAGFDMLGMVAYNPPRRDEGCRVCLTLEGRGDTNQLYDNHIHSFPTGCPRYISFSIEEMQKVAAEAKLCLKCHDPEYVWRKNDRDHNCPVKPGMNRKSHYTCTDQSCTNHMWICSRHKQQNLEKLKSFKEEIARKYSLNFGYVVSCPIISRIDNFLAQEVQGKEESIQEKKLNLLPKKNLQLLLNLNKLMRMKILLNQL